MPAGGSATLADCGISASGDYILFMQTSTNHGNAASIYMLRITGSAKIITAVYEGDSNYAPRVSSSGAITVNGFDENDVGIACRIIKL